MLKISFTDFWPGFQEDNNLITNILKEIFEEEIYLLKVEIDFIWDTNSKKN